MEAASVPALRKLEPRSSPSLGLFLAGNLWDNCAEESRSQGHALPGSTQESTPLQALSPRAFHTRAQEDFGTSMRMPSWRHLPHRCGLQPQQQVGVIYEHRQSTTGGQDHHTVRGQVSLSRSRNRLGLGFGARGLLPLATLGKAGYSDWRYPPGRRGGAGPAGPTAHSLRITAGLAEGKEELSPAGVTDQLDR